MKRLIDDTVRSGLVIAWRLAGSPTLRSSPSKPIIEGVVLFPSSLVITTGSLPSNTATHEFVVLNQFNNFSHDFILIFNCLFIILIIQKLTAITLSLLFPSY